MTNEEMKKNLENNGYTIHKKMDEKLLKRRNEICWEVADYVSKQLNKIGYYYVGYTDSDTASLARTALRKKMKKMGYEEYHLIPDYKWPEVKKILLQEAKDYVDRRVKKLKEKRT